MKVNVPKELMDRFMSFIDLYNSGNLHEDDAYVIHMKLYEYTKDVMFDKCIKIDDSFSFYSNKNQKTIMVLKNYISMSMIKDRIEVLEKKIEEENFKEHEVYFCSNDEGIDIKVNYFDQDQKFIDRLKYNLDDIDNHLRMNLEKRKKQYAELKKEFES